MTIRTKLAPLDVDSIIRMHGAIYGREHGFDSTFEDYVAVPLRAFARGCSRRERIWIAERDGQIVGCVAVVAAPAPNTAQLRWFLVAPEARGHGLGRQLLNEAVAFARTRGYDRVILWTVSALAAAARLYRSVGFEKVLERPAHVWGAEVVEEKYELDLHETRECQRS